MIADQMCRDLTPMRNRAAAVESEKDANAEMHNRLTLAFKMLDDETWLPLQEMRIAANNAIFNATKGVKQ